MSEEQPTSRPDVDLNDFRIQVRNEVIQEIQDLLAPKIENLEAAMSVCDEELQLANLPDLEGVAAGIQELRLSLRLLR